MARNILGVWHHPPSKGPWRSSKTPGINQALSLAYLKQAELVTLRDGWIKLHHSK